MLLYCSAVSDCSKRQKWKWGVSCLRRNAAQQVSADWRYGWFTNIWRIFPRSLISDFSPLSTYPIHFLMRCTPCAHAAQNGLSVRNPRSSQPTMTSIFPRAISVIASSSKRASGCKEERKSQGLPCGTSNGGLGLKFKIRGLPLSMSARRGEGVKKVP